MSENRGPTQDVRVWRGSFREQLRDGAQSAAIRLMQAVIFFGGLFVAHRLLTFALVLMAADANQVRQNANAAVGYLGRAIEAGYLPKPIDDKGTLPPKPSTSPSASASPEPAK